MSPGACTRSIDLERQGECRFWLALGCGSGRRCPGRHRPSGIRADGRQRTVNRACNTSGRSCWSRVAGAPDLGTDWIHARRLRANGALCKRSQHLLLAGTALSSAAKARLHPCGDLLEEDGLDFLRESLTWVVQQLMEAEVSELVGAARGSGPRAAADAPKRVPALIPHAVLPIVRSTRDVRLNNRQHADDPLELHQRSRCLNIQPPCEPRCNTNAPTGGQGSPRLQRLPRTHPARPRHTTAAAANKGSPRRLPQQRPRRPDLSIEPVLTDRPPVDQRGHSAGVPVDVECVARYRWMAAARRVICCRRP
jgi:hypothetical protein